MTFCGGKLSIQVNIEYIRNNHLNQRKHQKSFITVICTDCGAGGTCKNFVSQLVKGQAPDGVLTVRDLRIACI